MDAVSVVVIAGKQIPRVYREVFTGREHAVVHDSDITQPTVDHQIARRLDERHFHQGCIQCQEYVVRMIDLDSQTFRCQRHREGFVRAGSCERQTVGAVSQLAACGNGDHIGAGSDRRRTIQPQAVCDDICHTARRDVMQCTAAPAAAPGTLHIQVVRRVKVERGAFCNEALTGTADAAAGGQVQISAGDCAAAQITVRADRDRIVR